MTDYFRKHLGAKLFLSYLAVILVGALALAITTKFTVQPAFNRHLGRMDEVSPQGNVGEMMGARGKPGEGFGKELFTNFEQSFQEAINWAALSAGLAALLASLYLSKRVVTPVHAMRTASSRIAEGHYDERVDEKGADELSQLAHSFNRMAEKLAKVEEMRRQLIGDVAHELRTPLTAIIGSAEGLEDGILPASAETYQIIHREAKRLNALVDDLQELSRVEARAYELNRQPIQFSTLTKIIDKRFSPRFEEKGVSFEIKITEPLPPVQADEGRIVQVLTNLLNNALHYTPKGGAVTLSIRSTETGWEVSVRDTGIGIPKGDLAHIFTRFYRVDKSRSRHAGGSGIGLTITKHLVEAHEGEIWVESEGEGKGSAFVFCLPF